MPEIRLAQIVLFYLFDVAETIDLQAIPGLIGGPAVVARLAPKPATPDYIQYEKPPLLFDGETVGVAELDGFRVRVRVYDYGVISLALTRSFAGAWTELVGVGQDLIESPELEQRAEQACRTVARRLRGALKDYRDAFLSEDYLVYVVNELEQPLSADALVVSRG